MGISKKINEIERGFSWSLLGVIVAVLFGSVTVYVEFIKENKPDLNFIITGNSGVLDIRENLGSLDVLYQGESLSKKNKDLRIITFKVINQGDASILSNFYDPNDPLGFNVNGGVIADEPKLIKASNSYLTDQLKINKSNNNRVTFSNVILEENEFFEIKILILHDIASEPIIEPYGKIAGVNTIDLLADYDSGVNQSFINETFSGNLPVTVVRLVGFGIAFFVIIMGLFFVSMEIDEKKEKRRKTKLITIFKEYESDKVTEKDGFFFDYYLSTEAMPITKINDILSNHELATKISKIDFGDEGKRPKSREAQYRDEYELLVNEGFITLEGEILSIDEERAQVLLNFVDFLKRKGEFKKRSRHERLIVESTDE